MSALVTLYEDEDLLAVDKPSGLSVHRGLARERDTMMRRLKDLRPGQRLHLLHRLDRATSGVVVLAKSPEVARSLSGSWREGTQKVYLALVRGEAPARGEIDHPVPSDPDGPRVPAQSSFRRLGTVETTPRWTSLLEVRPRTGRFHQIRRHLKHINHPLIGDTNYGKGPLNRELAERYGARRLALHAWQLRFPHPRTGADLLVAAPVPEDLAGAWSAMGLDPVLWAR